ncbi:protein FAM227B-like [Astyanax mexicanus]|uniref:Protein FAM227B-like n=1 Tax=Astyanax mexicanus TaxID=7994 RepID=A0A8T2LMU6_ASTMX|nr:protein FAM227B-like [Astyanax mexicanus]
MEAEREKQTEQPLITSLQEFIHSQRLVDWPVNYEEHVQTFPVPFTKTEQIYKHLKERVSFPAHISGSLLKDTEELWARVKDLESRLYLLKCRAPVEEL